MRILVPLQTDVFVQRAHLDSTFKTCESFALQGHSVTLLVPLGLRTWFDKQTLSDSLMEKYRIKQRFGIAGVPVFPDGGPFPFNKVNGLAFALYSNLYALLARPTAVFTRDLGFSRLFAKLRRRGIGKDILFVYDVHDLHSERETDAKKKAAFLDLERLVLGSADVVVVMMMEPVAKLVEARGVEAKRIVAASMGVDLSRFTGLTREACRAKVGLSDEKTRIALYAGHLYAWKGVYLLAEAMKSVPDVTCWMVGGLAEDLAKMETFLREKDIQNVVLKGTVAPAEVPFFLKAADVLVVPSPSIDPAHAAENKSSEPQGLLGFGTPMKLFEYMASGTPIVATDVVAHRQVLHNQNSVVVKSDSVPALSDGIREALSDPKKSAARAKNASETAKSFDWSRRSVPILAKIKELYPDRAD